ncbi:hypothetical protein SAY86_026935 [Trapa natans]|uniref:MYB-CC type transcription factor LHEQLE-containing domain-containing protein n=1 Tax=Trapa natans TaxID=22666 RepID=A0AAN7QLK8_TRANT|nr:hypothetical protein SAY86_026935 [Trapa natans]
MYHHGSVKNIHPSSRMPIPSSARHLFLQGGNGPGDSGLVLSTDAKPRLKWTTDLHERFVEAVSHLGGADSKYKSEENDVKVVEFSWKTIRGDMADNLIVHFYCRGYTKNSNEANGDSRTNSLSFEEPSPAGAIPFVGVDKMHEQNGAHMSTCTQPNKCVHFSEALQMQIEVQRRLHEQLEVQRHLQIRIEAQGKYLQAVLAKAQETLGRQNLGSAAGLEAAKVQLSELASKVSAQSLNSEFPTLKELHQLCPRKNQPEDCSVDSCLTYCEGPQKEDPVTEPIELNWVPLDSNNNAVILSARSKEALDRRLLSVTGQSGSNPNTNNLSTGFGLRRGPSGRDDDGDFLDRVDNNRMQRFEMKLDLNDRQENEAASGFKQFDLNGFSGDV